MAKPRKPKPKPKLRKPTTAARLSKLETERALEIPELNRLANEVDKLLGLENAVLDLQRRLAAVGPRDIPSSCGNCRFFAANHREAHDLNGAEHVGFCRRRPPGVNREGWPRVPRDTWCGEWEA